MSGIVGIAQTGRKPDVSRMLTKIAYRGRTSKIVETASATLGIVSSHAKGKDLDFIPGLDLVRENTKTGHAAPARKTPLQLKRDPLGVSPLYYGWTKRGYLCFASEVKGLLEVTQEVHELPPGHTFDGKKMEAYYELDKLPALEESPIKIATELRNRLEAGVKNRIDSTNPGAWLSGGLDSSTLAAIASQYVHPFHTFTVGFKDAPDVKHAHVVAGYIKSDHHVHYVTKTDLLQVLPDVIYHLESFDAWLVRSSIMNYLVARLAADYVPAVFSGEGGDELFAGYDYLRSLDPVKLDSELIDIISRLHNTALQRVDRSAAAHGTVAHVVFLDPQVVDFALRIPIEYKLHDGIGKWILRQAMSDSLPDSIVNRPKSKFWQGSGVESLLAEFADSLISDHDFSNRRMLSNGWKLNSKEELLYYNIFKDHFGELSDLRWMGRTKGTPIQ